MKRIQLTQNKYTIVDDENYEELSKYRWYLNTFGYVRRWRPTIERQAKPGSREIFLHRHLIDVPKGYVIDHINGDKLDNRRCNLRVCTPHQNRMNRQSQKNNTSGYKGVFWNKQRNKWSAKINFNHKQIYTGYFDNKEDAAKAYERAARKYFGEFARSVQRH